MHFSDKDPSEHSDDHNVSGTLAFGYRGDSTPSSMLRHTPNMAFPGAAYVGTQNGSQGQQQPVHHVLQYQVSSRKSKLLYWRISNGTLMA